MKYKRTNKVWFPDEERVYYEVDAFQWNGNENDIPEEFKNEFKINSSTIWLNDGSLGLTKSQYAILMSNGKWSSCSEGFFKLMFKRIDDE